MSGQSWRERQRLKRSLTVLSGHSSRAMWLLVPFVPAFMLFSHIAGWSSKDGAHFNSVFWAVVAALIACSFVFYRIERHRSLRFLMWLHDHREELRTEGGAFYGQQLSRMSEVVQYEICVSMFVLYVQFRTSYYPKDRSSVIRALSTIFIFLFGWWSLWGPVITIKNLVLNIRGGHRISVQDLLNQIPN